MVCMAEAALTFKGQKSSLLDFEKIDANQWLDFTDWKEQRAFRDTYTQWETFERLKDHHEKMGRVIDCVGECRVYRGEGQYRISHLTQLQEGDEVVTAVNSYIWIFLFDGTLVRLSPESSITFKEINNLPNKIFLHARLNKGNILWLNRSQSEVEELTLRETDVSFFPMSLYEANPYTKDGNISIEEYLFGELEIIRDQYIRANELIRKNNKYINKITESFLVLPTVTVFGASLSLEAYLDIARDNYFKVRSGSLLNLKNHPDPDVTINLRGYLNIDQSSVQTDQWYVSRMPGKLLEEVEADRKQNINEIITKRIPSLYVARELMLERYSKFLFEEESAKKLAQDYGYRLWTSEELEKRKDFLWQFTTRLETSNIAVAERYRKAVVEKYGIVEKDIIRNEFFKTALARYIQRGEVNREKFYLPHYNSEKREIWKRIHGIRSKTKISPRIRIPKEKGTSGVDESSSDNTPF